ncbi:MAG TPA: hypothetical protein VEU32_07460 [Burkholderiales bacterium]|nr:hypothetical protein [Burkholderiales bacterium]
MSWLRNSAALAALAASASWADTMSIEVTALKHPVDKSYRKMVKGMDLFERAHSLAPQAALRYKLLQRKPGGRIEHAPIQIVGRSFTQPVRVAADHTFTLPRERKALDEDAVVQSERKAETMTWRADVRTPGLPSGTRRLGDLRLECEVGMEAGLVSRYSLLDRFFDLLQDGREYCSGQGQKYLFFAERPLFSVTLESGDRREALPIEKLYAASINGCKKDELRHCDCEALLDRAYVLPLGDKSWPDDTRVELEYMDAPAEPTAADAANDALLAGESKAQVQSTYGAAPSIRFDTGYEVWSYRYGKTEFSVLFAPSGVVEKTRLRPA